MLGKARNSFFILCATTAWAQMEPGPTEALELEKLEALALQSHELRGMDMERGRDGHLTLTPFFWIRLLFCPFLVRLYFSATCELP